MWCLQVSVLFDLMKVGGVLHEDKWLWQFFQTSEFDGRWPTVLCVVYQGMYLYINLHLFVLMLQKVRVTRRKLC